MDNQVYQEISDKIESHNSVVEFSDYGDGINAEWIDKAECALGVLLPNSYKWWLLNYGGGEIGGEEIFSIYGLDFDDISGGDIVKMYNISKANGIADYLIPICHSDVDGIFYFKIETGLEDNEYHIFSQATGGIYANNFLDFLDKRISALD